MDTDLNFILSESEYKRIVFALFFRSKKIVVSRMTNVISQQNKNKQSQFRNLVVIFNLYILDRSLSIESVCILPVRTRVMSNVHRKSETAVVTYT
jgi:hypothetical protein